MTNSPNIRSRYTRSLWASLCVFSLFPPALAQEEEEREDIFELSPFEVQSRALEGYIASSAISATKIDTPIRNLPLSLDVVTEAMIEEYGARSLREMVELSGNITASDKPNTLNVQFILRGFSTYINMRNGMARVPNVYGSNVARVEIVRGPTAVLYGITDPGGAINVITRSPTGQRYTSIEYTFGTEEHHSVDFRWSGAFGEDKRLLSRIDASWLDRGGFRDHMNQKTKFVSTSNLIVLSPRVSLSLEGEFRDLKDTPGSWWPRVQDAATKTFEMYSGVPGTFNANVPGHFRDAESFVGTATLNVRIGEQAFYRGSYNYYGRDFSRLTSDSTRVIAGRFLSRYMTGREEDTALHSLYNQINVNFLKPDYDLRMVFGHEYKDSYIDLVDRRTDGSTEPQIWDLTAPDTWDMSVPAFEDLLLSESNRVENAENEFYGVGHLTFADERYSILGGVRYSDLEADSVDRRRDSELSVSHGKWSYQVGAIYRPIRNLGLYTNYSESFRTITNILRRNPDRTFSPFDPTEGTGKEIGLKLDLLDEALAFNFALYEIEQTGVRRVVPFEDDFGTIQVDTQSGRERARGFDLTLNWNVRRNWQIIASLAYNDAKTISNEQAPAFEGRMLPNTPEWMTHLSTRYSFQHARLKGLTVGGTWRYVDDTLAYNTVDDFFLKGFHVVNAFVEYRRDIRPGVPLIFRLNALNLFDEFYFPDTSGPGLPRTVRFTTMIKF
jgi:iron complex outermembrane recepter protein